MNSVYQSNEYKEALKKSGPKIIDISDSYFAIEKTISLPIGKKTILEARGTPNQGNLDKFKEISKKYFYGTIAATVVADKELFEKNNMKKTTNFTILLDLKKTKEELFQMLEKKSIRWGVKTAEKNNLIFNQASEQDLDLFYEMYKKTSQQGNFQAESKSFIEYISKTDKAKLFVIKDKKEIVAGGMILIDKDYNYSILDLTSASEKGLDLQAMPFLYWNLILYSKSLNLEKFDLGGYDKESKQGEKTYNINKFKERFNGEIVEQPIFSTNNKYSNLRQILKKYHFMKAWYKK